MNRFTTASRSIACSPTAESWVQRLTNEVTKELGLPGTPADWNHLLMRLRKCRRPNPNSQRENEQEFSWSWEYDEFLFAK